MSTVWAGRIIAIVGAAGKMGACALRQLQFAPDRPARILAIDREFDGDCERTLKHRGIEVHRVDVASGELSRILFGVDLVFNFAGPFYLLGDKVLKAALEARCDYVDICDDADAVRAMLELDAAAGAAKIRALIGAGSAPGVTNLLAALALESLEDTQDSATEHVHISWATPIGELSPGVFRHVLHCLRSPLPDGRKPSTFEDLRPEVIEFPDPVGALETVLFSHPEPTTFRHFRNIDVELRGAVAPSEFLRRAWSVATAQAGTPDSHAEYSAGLAALSQSSQGSLSRWGALNVEAWRGDRGIRIQTLSDESMEETTVSPCIAFARINLCGLIPKLGVISPEVLSPRDFFSTDLPKGRGRTRVERLVPGQPPERSSLRALLSAPRAATRR